MKLDFISLIKSSMAFVSYFITIFGIGSLLLVLGQKYDGDIERFNCRNKPRISRFPHPKSCFLFIYCVSGVAHPAKCWPEGARFNPKSGRCDLLPSERCDSDPQPQPTTISPTIINAFSIQTTEHGSIGNTELVEHLSHSSTTTDAPSTPTPRPPKLSDKFSFRLNCGSDQTPCGLYPNHINGNCSTFLQCTHSRKLITKNCHGGQHFDTKSQECKPKELASCWKQPCNGPFLRNRGILPPLCEKHALNATGKDEVLSSPVVTNWGVWGPWQFCPTGRFITGINGWRRLLSIGTKNDHAGLVSLGLECRTPYGQVSGQGLISIAPNAPNDGFPSFYSCPKSGTAVGFRLNSQPDQGPGNDNLATDNVQLICSCGGSVHKPYETFAGSQSGNRGVWTEAQICRPLEALCGVQTQMAEYREGVVGSFDNTGMNNMKAKCCPVLHPAETCSPLESLEFVRSCKNLEGIYPSRCDFEATLGLSYNAQDPSLRNAANFYKSVGYDYSAEEFKEKLMENFKKLAKSKYPWREVEGSLLEFDNATNWLSNVIYLQTNTSVDIYQIVGNCGIFTIRTNRFLRKIKNYDNGDKLEEYFEI